VKKFIPLFLAILLVSSFASAEFAPTLLGISGSQYIQYNFDGSNLSIPVIVSQKNARVMLTIFTKGKGSQILDIRNGNLGWHYMNKIDTCLFVSSAYDFAPGVNEINWDGNVQSSEGGGLVPADSYTYYLWGYDYASPRELAVSILPYNWKCDSRIITTEEDGTIKTKPMISDQPDDDGLYEEFTTFRYMRWNLGDDPADTGLVTSSFISAHNSSFSLALDPSNYNTVFHEDIRSGGGGNGTYAVSKYTWIPNDFAVKDLAWGGTGDGELSWTLTGYDYDIGSPFTIDPTMLISSIGCGDMKCMDSYLISIDMQTGEELRRMDTKSRFVFQRPSDGAWRNRTPCDWSFVNGVLSMIPHYSIMMAGADPYAEDQENFWLWHNVDGDNFHDHYSDSATYAANPIPQYVYGGRQDSNNFLTTPTYDLGSVTFDLTSPDGTGMGVFAVSDEGAGMKSNTIYVDYGSAYDGMYICGNVTAGWYFIGQDSFKGTITQEVIAETSAPAAYSVAQNTPNPFNPTTTINFNIAKAGKVTVDIYNVAGQKVDTLVNGNQSAGNHSVVWNASKFSAGVYFYTVKSGSFSKTMKMTLVK